MRYGILISVLVFLFGAASFSTHGQTAARTITVLTEPNAKVWVDDVLR